MDGKVAMSQYCKAQAQLIKLDKEDDEQRKALHERIRTYRSLLHDELNARQLTCVEVIPEGAEEPVYVRLKQQTSTTPLNAELVFEILRQIDHGVLGDFAEKNGHDFPRMVAAVLTHEIKTTHSKKLEKSSLAISTTKERGFVRSPVPNEVQQIATDLLTARSELSKLKQKGNVAKKPIIEEQKQVEETVKESLRASDPVNMMTRVHMMQDGGEWVYYLRCKQKETHPVMGVRRVVPIVESAFEKTLADHGMSREYNASLRLTAPFWNAFNAYLTEYMDAATKETKISSRLTLDRGAPRRYTKRT